MTKNKSERLIAFVDVFDLPDSAAVSRDAQDIFDVTKFQLQLSHGTDYDVSVKNKTSHCRNIAVPGLE